MHSIYSRGVLRPKHPPNYAPEVIYKIIVRTAVAT